MLFPAFLLPDALQLKDCSLSLLEGHLIIKTSSCQTASICPSCGCVSERSHSRYKRVLGDLPSSGYSVRVLMLSRKYFCDNPDCTQKVFTERFKKEISPYHRRFNRCTELLRSLALELGGNKGSAIAYLTHLPVSPSTILRVIKRLELVVPQMTSGIIGIDDWAFKKAKTYGTIIVDLYPNKVIDLLPDREAATVSQWFKGHQEVRVISRDRGGPYSKGGREGAPQAIQVADRFHLLMNLGEATKKMFQSMGKELTKAFTLYNNPEASTTLPSATEIISLKEQEMPTAMTFAMNSNPELLLRFSKVKELKDKGYTIRAISRSLGITRITIRKYLRMDFLPKKTGSRSTNFDAYQGYLLQETNAGRLYTDLHADIVKLGFNGGYTQFCNNMNMLLKSYKITRPHHKTDPSIIKTWSAGKLSFLLQKERAELTTEDKKFLGQLCRQYRVVNQTAKQVKQFKKLFRDKQEGSLQQWLNDVEKSISGLKVFAKGAGKIILPTSSFSTLPLPDEPSL
ncbi:ISL3 family transposase [Flavitalea antarctica]